MIIDGFKSWDEFLLDHESNEIYNFNSAKLVKLFEIGKSQEDYFENSRQNPSLIFLLVSLKHTIHATFHHDLIGNEILGEKKTPVGLTGLSTRDFPEEIDIVNIFTWSKSSLKVPSLKDFQSLTTSTKFDCIVLNSDLLVPNFAVQPPCLEKPLLEAKSKCPRSLLINMILSAQEFDHSHPEVKILDHCYSCFIFVWAIGSKNANLYLKRSFSAVITDQLEIKWAADAHKLALTSKDPQDQTDQGLHQDINHDSLNLATVINKFSETVNCSTTAKSSSKEKSEEEKKIKNWNDLDEVVRTLILNVGSESGTEPLIDPPPTMVEFLNKKSDTAALAWLYFRLKNTNMYIVPGMATALVKGQILSIPNWKSVSNLSVLFCPPRSKLITDPDNFLRLQVQEEEGKSYDAADVKLATAQKPYWARDTNGLKRQISNFVRICSILFGYRSFLVAQLLTWTDHIDQNELCYDDYIGRKNSFFIPCLLNKIHQGDQHFLWRSADSWDPSNWRLIDFSVIQFDIITDNFIVTKPSWIPEEKVKETPTPSGPSNYNKNCDKDQDQRPRSSYKIKHQRKSRPPFEASHIFDELKSRLALQYNVSCAEILGEILEHDFSHSFINAFGIIDKGLVLMVSKVVMYIGIQYNAGIFQP